MPIQRTNKSVYHFMIIDTFRIHLGYIMMFFKKYFCTIIFTIIMFMYFVLPVFMFYVFLFFIHKLSTKNKSFCFPNEDLSLVSLFEKIEIKPPWLHNLLNNNSNIILSLSFCYIYFITLKISYFLLLLLLTMFTNKFIWND